MSCLLMATVEVTPKWRRIMTGSPAAKKMSTKVFSVSQPGRTAPSADTVMVQYRQPPLAESINCSDFSMETFATGTPSGMLYSEAAHEVR
jgi:hypothetical protein